MIRLVCVIGALLFLGSCTSQEFIDRKPPTAKVCAAKGQYLDYLGMFGHAACVQHYSDAGKTCRNKSECFGGCLVELGTDEANRHDYRVGVEASGQCAWQSALDGCIAIIEGGKVTEAVCSD